MNKGRTVFAQLLDFLPQYEFDKCVARYELAEGEGVSGFLLDDGRIFWGKPKDGHVNIARDHGLLASETPLPAGKLVPQVKAAFIAERYKSRSEKVASAILADVDRRLPAGRTGAPTEGNLSKFGTPPLPDAFFRAAGCPPSTAGWKPAATFSDRL